MMLIHKICMAFRGLGSFRNVDIVINEIAAMLLHMENRKKKTVKRNLSMFVYMEKGQNAFPIGHA